MKDSGEKFLDCDISYATAFIIFIINKSLFNDLIQIKKTRIFLTTY